MVCLLVGRARCNRDTAIVVRCVVTRGHLDDIHPNRSAGWQVLVCSSDGLASWCQFHALHSGTGCRGHSPVEHNIADSFGHGSGWLDPLVGRGRMGRLARSHSQHDVGSVRNSAEHVTNDARDGLRHYSRSHGSNLRRDDG
jgi:hypothetical protein